MTKTLKRVIALLSVSMFMALFSLSCFAQENSSAKKIYTEDLGDGITAVVTLSETNGMARSSKTYNVTKEYRISPIWSPRMPILRSWTRNWFTR